tara:strand:- start:32 stop:268 length:237 start_codon:yes stop_codon:yes gene_type:complete
LYRKKVETINIKTDAIIETIKELSVRFNNLSKLILSKLEKILIKLKRTGTRKAKIIGIRQIKYIINFTELFGLINGAN